MLNFGMNWIAVGLTSLITCTALANGEAVPENVIYSEDFSEDMDDWWVEGGERVWIKEGRLHMKADPVGKTGGHVATVWCRKRFEGDISVECDAHVIRSSKDVNNINFFLLYSYPGDKTMWETREERADADYRKYHDLNGYIFTFLRAQRKQDKELAADERPGRFRIRRCPGFKLLDEAYTYECQQGRTYHIEYTKRGTELTIKVDGEVRCTAEDTQPLQEGLIGLRTYRTYLWWDNIRAKRLD